MEHPLAEAIGQRLGDTTTPTAQVLAAAVAAAVRIALHQWLGATAAPPPRPEDSSSRRAPSPTGSAPPSFPSPRHSTPPRNGQGGDSPGDGPGHAKLFEVKEVKGEEELSRTDG
ncbi:hypothetical protein ACFQVA_05680 [Actinomadura keratinilytica]